MRTMWALPLLWACGGDDGAPGDTATYDSTQTPDTTDSKATHASACDTLVDSLIDAVPADSSMLELTEAEAFCDDLGEGHLLFDGDDLEVCAPTENRGTAGFGGLSVEGADLLEWYAGYFRYQIDGEDQYFFVETALLATSYGWSCQQSDNSPSGGVGPGAPSPGETFCGRDDTVAFVSGVDEVELLLPDGDRCVVQLTPVRAE